MMNAATFNPGLRDEARAARFTPCMAALSLLEEGPAAVNGYRLSRACSSFGPFRYHQTIVEAHYSMVKTTGGGAPVAHPNPDGETTTLAMADRQLIRMQNLIRGFLRENPGANNRTKLDLNERTRHSP
jgi:hypothetical protein